jgi:hypothetical protein
MERAARGRPAWSEFMKNDTGFLQTDPVRHMTVNPAEAGARVASMAKRPGSAVIGGTLNPDIGIAIGSGSDVAKETGGIILVKNDVRDVVTGIRLSAATMRTIRGNLFWAFVYNGIGVPIAAPGLRNPIIAAAAMALSSLSVIVNSALLKRASL